MPAAVTGEVDIRCHCERLLGCPVLVPKCIGRAGTAEPKMVSPPVAGVVSATAADVAQLTWSWAVTNRPVRSWVSAVRPLAGNRVELNPPASDPWLVDNGASGCERNGNTPGLV